MLGFLLLEGGQILSSINYGTVPVGFKSEADVTGLVMLRLKRHGCTVHVPEPLCKSDY